MSVNARVSGFWGWTMFKIRWDLLGEVTPYIWEQALESYTHARET